MRHHQHLRVGVALYRDYQGTRRSLLDAPSRIAIWCSRSERQCLPRILLWGLEVHYDTAVVAFPIWRLTYVSPERPC